MQPSAAALYWAFLKTYENWPVNEDTHKPLKIVDKELFLDELVAHLMEEDERGLTPIHRAFEEALGQPVRIRD